MDRLPKEKARIFHFTARRGGGLVPVASMLMGNDKVTRPEGGPRG